MNLELFAVMTVGALGDTERPKFLNVDFNARENAPSRHYVSFVLQNLRGSRYTDDIISIADIRDLSCLVAEVKALEPAFDFSKSS